MELATSKATSFTDKPTQPAHQLFTFFSLDQNCLGHNFKAWELIANRQFLEITGKDNLTVFSYRESEVPWRWQWRRADLRHFEIFRHGPIIIYTRLPAGVTYYPICAFSTSSECLIGISIAFSAFCLQVSIIFPTCSLYPQQKHVCSALNPQAWTLYIQVHARRLLRSAAPWISKDRLLPNSLRILVFP